MANCQRPTFSTRKNILMLMEVSSLPENPLVLISTFSVPRETWFYYACCVYIGYFLFVLLVMAKSSFTQLQMVHSYSNK